VTDPTPNDQSPWAQIEAQLAEVSSYASAAEAVRDAAVRAFEYAASRCSITGFQGGWAALSFYGKVMGVDGPYMVLKAHDALYPQYDLLGRVREWLTSDEMRTWLADEADKKLSDHRSDAVPAVRDHWRRLSLERPPRPEAASGEEEGHG